MKFFGIILFASMVSVAASANFTGHWAGSGSINNDQGQSSNCEDMQADVQQTTNSFAVRYKFKCGEMTMINDTQPMQISGNELIAHGKVIGTIDEKLVYIKINGFDGRSYRYIMRLTAENQIEYSDNLGGDVYFSEIQGILTRK